jgi:hypothetical protein
MKPFIEVMKDMVVIETEGMVITVHVSADFDSADFDSAQSATLNKHVKDDLGGSDPGCGLTYHRKAVIEAEEELQDAIDEYVDSQPPVKRRKGKRSYQPRQCEVCGKTYTPTGATQKFCSDACKARSKGKKLSEMEERELEKTLADIEERRKRTYEVSR